METTASRSCRTRNLRERRAAALADLTALTGTEELTGQTESLAREDKKTLFIDKDNVLVKFQLGIDQLNETEKYLECICVFCNFAA